MMSIPKLSRAARKRTERDLYQRIRSRFDSDMPRFKKRYTKAQFKDLALMLDDKTSLVMYGIVRQAINETVGLGDRHVNLVINEIKKYNLAIEIPDRDILRKEVVDRLATIQMTRMLHTVDKTIHALEGVKGIGPKRFTSVTENLARLLRENN